MEPVGDEFGLLLYLEQAKLEAKGTDLRKSIVKKFSLASTCLLLLTGMFGCTGNSATTVPARPPEPITADCIIVHSIADGSTYKIIDSECISETRPLLSTSIMLKEEADTIVWALQDDRVVEVAYMFERERYTSWDEEIPEALCDAVNKITTDENRVFCYRFIAYDTNSHDQRMEAIHASESAQFVTPADFNFDGYYPTLTLYYSCYNSNLSFEREKENDVVFDDTIHRLEQQNLTYKILEPTLSAAYAKENYYSRRVEILLNDPLNEDVLNEIEAIIENSTSEAPFVDPDNLPSGRAVYTEPESYAIYMITPTPVSAENLEQMSLEFDIEYSGESLQ